jgi:hypothetical protein
MAKSTKSTGAAAKSRSDAPVTGTPTGAGPDVAGGASSLTGIPPALSEERHGGKALEGKPEPGARPASGQAENTGPVVENTGGGLEFEKKPSGTRAQPRKEQPTTPERAEIVEARRLEREIQRAKVNPASAARGASKVGDRIRVLRNAASGWEMGTVTHLAGAGGMAELDGGEVVGLEAGRWEPAVGALAAPTVDERDLREHGGTIDRQAQDAVANAQEAGNPRAAAGQEPKSKQTAARPSRARTEAQKAARRKASKKAAKAAKK